MRITELSGFHEFQLREGASLPDPAPGEVQARVAAVGVCGSDLHYFAEGSVGDVACVYPMVLGHEPAGTIVKTGPGVTGWAPGDRAVLEPALYCYHCEFCRSGRHNVCANIRFMSQPQIPGFLREYVNLPATNLLPIPRGLSFGEATLFEPLAIILHSMKLAAPALGEDAVVFGAGPIGLITMLALRLAGAGRIWAVEPVAHRRELALQMGADAVIDPGAVDPVKSLLQETGRRGVDLAMDCAARGESMNQAAGAVRNAGRVVVTGIPVDGRIALDFHILRRKEAALLNVRRSCHDSETALEMLREHRARFTPLLTHQFPLENTQRAFETLESYSDGVGKVVIKVD